MNIHFFRSGTIKSRKVCTGIIEKVGGNYNNVETKGVLKIVDLMDKVQKIADIGKSTREKQRIISVIEVF